MTRSSLPDDVRRFVLTSIPSVPYLEAALLFHSRPQQTRTLAEVAAGLYTTERQAAALLAALGDAGVLAAVPEGYVWSPRDERLQAAFDRLAAAYAADLVTVSNLIHDATQKSAQRFADAFRLRKDD